MPKLYELLANNAKWSEQMTNEDPEFFERLVHTQSPEYLWIGCSDSRVPANEIVGLLPGEIFVHRNIANLVVHTDFNCMSVLEYSVEVLKIKHVLVVGHYGCGGVRAAISRTSFGLIDNWLYGIKNLYYRNKYRMDAIESEDERLNFLCELNVMQQVKNVAHTAVVQRAWERGQPLTIHGWIYSLQDGLAKDLGVSIQSLEELADEYRVVNGLKDG
ncbi:MAG: carbonate dehydratase [Gammaproteobacteria bacterium]|jgi:carbonic anhydrase